MKGFKITDAEGYTRNGVLWGEGIVHRAGGERNELCTDGMIHFFECIEHALFLHGMLQYKKRPYRLWTCEAPEGDEMIRGDFKMGCKELKTLRDITPEIGFPTGKQLVAFAVLCSKEVCFEDEWVKWSEAWLSGEDVTKFEFRNRFTTLTTQWALLAAHKLDPNPDTLLDYWSYWNLEECVHNACAYAWDDYAKLAQYGAKLDLVSIANKVLQEY